MPPAIEEKDGVRDWAAQGHLVGAGSILRRRMAAQAAVALAVVWARLDLCAASRIRHRTGGHQKLVAVCMRGRA